NPVAYYRLGFLYLYEKEWAKSIDSFRQSLLVSPSRKRYSLNQEQRLKANYYILKASQIIQKEILDEVEQIPNEELDLFGEIKTLIQDLKEARVQEEKPYQMVINGVEFKEITEREYERLSDPFENVNFFILNFM